MRTRLRALFKNADDCACLPIDAGNMANELITEAEFFISATTRRQSAVELLSRAARGPKRAGGTLMVPW
jgi:hypothetical protein